MPYPPDYGGVIDVFYRIKALHSLGVQIKLHCFTYGRAQAAELEKYCVEVHYYQRRLYRSLLFKKEPFISVSRQSSELLENLKRDNSPILFEGLHSCHHLKDPALANRKKMIRMHNVEHLYYAGLAQVEKNPFKRWYFLTEARKLKHFELILDKAAVVFAISHSDQKYFFHRHSNAVYLPAFHANEEFTAPIDRQSFAFYHGNLGVGENNEACLYLCDKIFPGLPFKLIIAGNNPSSELRKICENLPNVDLRTNLSPEEIRGMVQAAQLNILPTFQSTGIKLKLLYALFNGGQILVNSPMVRGTGLEKLVRVEDQVPSFRNAVEQLMKKPVSEELINARKKLFNEDFNNLKNAEIIVAAL